VDEQSSVLDVHAARHSRAIRIPPMPDIQPPKIGQKIYIPTALYIDHGRDDIQGGIATIDEIRPYGESNYFISVAELRPRRLQYAYNDLMKRQEKLKAEFGETLAGPDPDNSAESNPPNYGWSD
jgi:hypothetical protein